jgi:hypothetical protein
MGGMGLKNVVEKCGKGGVCVCDLRNASELTLIDYFGGGKKVAGARSKLLIYVVFDIC